jgi:ketosteroid isomerase-like protein
MSDEEQVLFANEVFYAAFAAADMAAMADIWAVDAPVSVVHPGAGAVCGRAAVIDSWHDILDGQRAFDIEFRGATVRLLGDSAIVVCYERVGRHHLVATNVFVRAATGWRLVHHQSSPTNVIPSERSEPPRLVH